MASFEKSGSELTVGFEPEERKILDQLLRQLEQVLAAEGEDPIRSRLYPNAYEDAEDQRSYEELVGDQLRNEKLGTVRATLASLTSDKVRLDQDSIHAWLVVLTDLRLAIGTRLDVTEETMAADLDPDDPDAPALSVLHWLGWVQESLLSHLT